MLTDYGLCPRVEPGCSLAGGRRFSASTDLGLCPRTNFYLAEEEAREEEAREEEAREEVERGRQSFSQVMRNRPGFPMFSLWNECMTWKGIA